MAEFLRIEGSGGILLLIATAIALLWANGPWAASYEHFWETVVNIGFGTLVEQETLREVVNTTLMTIFFFVVGLEIKREIAVGDLSDRKRAALPMIAAAGGMIVPALIFLALNAGTETLRGWGIPIATDIAFAVGVLELVGRGTPKRLRVLLVGLAIADDIGAIVVIALFYTDDLAPAWLLIAAVLIIVTIGMKTLRVWYVPVYVIVGFGVWFAVFESGVHATIAGVILGLITPAHPLLDPGNAREVVEQALDEPDAGAVRSGTLRLHETVSVAERLEHDLLPWSSYVIVPVFALANAGVRLDAAALTGAFTTALGLGIVLGLVVGKLAGVLTSARIGVWSGAAELPEGLGWNEIGAIGAIAGIGFTVSLFIAQLSFTGQSLQAAKVAILVASAIAALVGAGFLTMLRHHGNTA